MKLVFACSALLFSATLAIAQNNEVPRFSGSIAGGFTNPLGTTGEHLDTGWNIQGGAGVNFNAWLGAQIQGQFDDFGINRTTLDNAGFPDGAVHVFSATIDPIVHLTPHSHADIYLIGGGGLYHVYHEFTQPTVAAVTGYDPFFGFFTVGVPADQVLASYSVNKPGWNGGMGIAFGTKYHGKFFAEARFTHVFMSRGVHMDYLPVSFGFRW